MTKRESTARRPWHRFARPGSDRVAEEPRHLLRSLGDRKIRCGGLDALLAEEIRRRRQDTLPCLELTAAQLSGRDRRRHMMKRAATLLLAVALLSGCTTVKRFSYEGSSRDDWQQPERVISALGLRAGDQVADLGAGSGYFTIRLARAVGPSGRVYAVDVDEAMNEYLRKRAAQAGVANVDVILGRLDDPLLPDGAVDLVLVVDTYHHLANRVAYFRNLRRDLAPGGRVAVIDYDGRKGWFVRWTGHITPRTLLLSEMKEAGYEVAEEFDFIDRQSFVIFRPTGGPP